MGTPMTVRMAFGKAVSMAAMWDSYWAERTVARSVASMDGGLVARLVDCSADETVVVTAALWDPRRTLSVDWWGLE